MQTLAVIDGAADDLPDPDMVLTIKILEPIAIATRESRSARVLADVILSNKAKKRHSQRLKKSDSDLS